MSLESLVDQRLMKGRVDNGAKDQARGLEKVWASLSDRERNSSEFRQTHA